MCHERWALHAVIKLKVFLPLHLRFLHHISYTRLRRRISICIPHFDEIPQSTAEIKQLSVLENGRPAYWNSTSGFDFDLFLVIGMWLCISLPNSVIIGQSAAELWRHIYFSRWRPAAILDLTWIILDHPRSAIVGLRLVLKFGLDRIYSFGDIAIFIYWHLGLKLPIRGHFGGFWAIWGIFPLNDWLSKA